MGIKIIPYRNELGEMFKALNEEWLERYFTVEPVDTLLLSDPRTSIIDNGGYIFFAEHNDSIVGTVALIKHGETEFELGKMAVTENARGLGIGKLLMEQCITTARSLGLRKIILYSNTLLVPAINLYKKFGFVEVPLLQSEYRRTNIKMEKDLTGN